MAPFKISSHHERACGGCQLRARCACDPHLHVWARSGNGSNGFWANGRNHVTEFLGLNGCHLLGLVNLQFVLLSDKLGLGFPGTCQSLQLRFLGEGWAVVLFHTSTVYSIM